ncbi:MAG TPA: hypothetical protein VK437_01160 [Steroidobacteraceae bacterium]|nr:hypothetical protein [Steroidobacteraceae bacterium]
MSARSFGGVGALLATAVLILRADAQGQDQDQPTATLDLHATWTVEIKQSDKDMECEDRLTIHYSGTAKYQLLPRGYGSSHQDGSVLGSDPSKGVHGDRKGNFSFSADGGGACHGKGGDIIFTYRSGGGPVLTKDFPPVSVRLRAGDYRVSENLGDSPDDAAIKIEAKGEIHVGGQTIEMPPGPAWQAYAYLAQHSIEKIGAAMTGTFKPGSKDFHGSNSVTDTVEFGPDNFGPGASGTGQVNISYGLTVGDPEVIEAVLISNGYDDWMPTATESGREDLSGDQPLKVEVKLQNKNHPDKPVSQNAIFTFELTG